MNQAPRSRSGDLPRYLGKHVLPDLGDARLERQLAAVKVRTRSTLPRASYWAYPSRFALPAFALAAMTLVFTVAATKWLAPKPAASLAQSAVVESDEAGATAMHYPDGTTLRLDRGSRATLSTIDAAHIDVRLERGNVSVDIANPAQRTIAITAGGNVVAARGSGLRLCFSVSLDPDGGAPAVSVTKGALLVTLASGAVRTVGEGETWSSSSLPPPAPAPAAETTNFEIDDEVPSPSRAVRRVQGPRELLDGAQQALEAGRTKDAARAFDTLRRRYRNDGRAALAAFELGRIRLDQFGDAVGAEEAFRDALALAPPLSVREDAEARRVQSLDRMSAHDRCVTARDAFLARFPTSAHRGAVLASCRGE